MKGVILGDWKWEVYEKALSDGFKKNGHGVSCFKTKIDFNTIFDKLQYKLRLGPLINEINREVLDAVLNDNYDFVFLQRPLIIKRSTIYKIKKSTNSKIICFHNDNPFHQKHHNIKYWRFFSILSLCDLVYVYRPSNVSNAKQYGANNVKILLPYYVKGLHDTENRIKKTNDVIFIGHFEDDGRDQIINYLIKNNIDVKVFGGKWEKSRTPSKFCNPPIYGNNYVKEMQRSKISIVFFSKINKDVYTRRSFEIPATKTFMLSEYSTEIVNLFKPGYEFDFFRDKEELYQKVVFYLKNDDLRKQMAERAYNRNIAHSNYVTAANIIEDLIELE